MSAPCASDAAGKAYFYYLCTKRKYYARDAFGGCRAHRINSERLHAAFWAKLTEMVCSDEVVDQGEFRERHTQLLTWRDKYGVP